jgi:rhamnosyltransferase
MSPPEVRASVVVPVRDGGPRLRELLASLARQELPGGLELVALDSGSRDGSRDALAAAGARVVDVAPGSFDHGETRNAGARVARAEFVLFLSQDAVPREPDYARRLVDALQADPRLAGVFARQEPCPEADPLTRRDLAHWVAAHSEARTVFLDDPGRLDALAPLQRYELCAFDNVASAVRREVLLRHPFAPTRFGEDIEWGQRLLRLGYGLAYVPLAVVVHSHARTARALYRRNYLGHRALLRLFGLRAIPDRAHLVRAALGRVVDDLVLLGREGAPLRLWLAAPGQALAAALGQYRGGRDETRLSPYPDWA